MIIRMLLVCNTDVVSPRTIATSPASCTHERISPCACARGAADLPAGMGADGPQTRSGAQLLTSAHAATCGTPFRTAQGRLRPLLPSCGDRSQPERRENEE